MSHRRYVQFVNDELITGLDFFIQEIPSEVFTFSPTDKVISYLPPRTPLSPIYPYLLCNIGSGVSMLKVSAPNTFESVVPHLEVELYGVYYHF